MGINFYIPFFTYSVLSQKNSQVAVSGWNDSIVEPRSHRNGDSSGVLRKEHMWTMPIAMMTGGGGLIRNMEYMGKGHSMRSWLDVILATLKIAADYAIGKVA